MEISKNKTQLSDEMLLKEVIYKKLKFSPKNGKVQKYFFVNNSFKALFSQIYECFSESPQILLRI